APNREHIRNMAEARAHVKRDGGCYIRPIFWPLPRPTTVHGIRHKGRLRKRAHSPRRGQGWSACVAVSHQRQFRRRSADAVGFGQSTGSRMEDIEGWSPLTEDTLKMLHLRDLPRKIGTFAEVIGKKDIFLVRAAQGRTFYIGDNPVVRHNSLDFGPYGNLGFDQKGIQIHLPLSAELTLCAYCPSIISAGIEENRQLMNRYRAELQAKAVQGLLT